MILYSPALSLILMPTEHLLSFLFKKKKKNYYTHINEHVTRLPKKTPKKIENIFKNYNFSSRLADHQIYR